MGLERAASPDLVSRLFPPGSEAALHLCRAAWPAAVGAELARRTEVLALEGRTLRVRVPDGGWRRVLHRLQGEILSRLSVTLGKAAPTKLGFTEGPVSVKEIPVPKPSAPASPTAGLLEAAEAISDPEIRERFLLSAASYLERSRNE